MQHARTRTLRGVQGDGQPEDSSARDEYVRAGLLDPLDPGAEQRLELLEWLRSQGFGVDDMVAAHHDLTALAGDAIQQAGATLTMRDVSARTGMSLAQLAEVHRAAGLAPVADDVPVFTERDLRTFELLLVAAELFSWDELLQFIRVMGSSIARIGDAANALFVQDVEQPMRRSGASEVELAQRNVQASRMAGNIGDVLGTYLRLHLQQATARSRLAYRRADVPGLMAPMAVGFVDLVGFTPRAATLNADGLVDLISRFEAAAHDVITDLGGRLVKLIGDEVMFVAVEPTTGCSIAVALLRIFGSDPALTPRGGLAYGEVLSRSGDYFGPTVNLAARLAEQAVPGEVLATPELGCVTDGVRVDPAGRRMLKGFADPVALVSITAAPV
jgi:adenylate cyclase